MEHQFDVADFKIVTETLPVDSLRHLPVGRDLDGLKYWTQIDETADIRFVWEIILFFIHDYNNNMNGVKIASNY